MRTYSYIIHYDNAKQNTEISDCKEQLRWSQIQSDSVIRIDTPKGTFAINMRHVTTIEETINETD